MNAVTMNAGEGAIRNEYRHHVLRLAVLRFFRALFFANLMIGCTMLFITPAAVANIAVVLIDVFLGVYESDRKKIEYHESMIWMLTKLKDAN